MDVSKRQAEGAAGRLRLSEAAPACVQALDLAPEGAAREVEAAGAERPP